MNNEKNQAGLEASAGDGAPLPAKEPPVQYPGFVIPAEPEFLNWSLAIRTQGVIIVETV
jgi:hypothetical protein